MTKESVQTATLDKNGIGIVSSKDFHSKQPLVFDCGKEIPEFSLRYESYGELNSQKNNAIMICHALSGDHHCAGKYSDKDRKTGWWDHVIGPGKPIDTDRFYVICSNCIGGCQGSTGPSSINPATGEAYNLNFPDLTIADMVRAQHLLCQHLGLPELYAVVGGSMGGMQALQWAIEYPEYVKRILPLATTARQNTQGIAFNEVGRNAIIQDPNWNEGNYSDKKGPDVGLAIARMMAHITYLSDKGLEEKFGRERKAGHGDRDQFDVEFQVESYLRYQGQSFVNRFDANTYLYFTKALDRFDLHKNGSLDEAFRQMQAKALVIGFTSDWLFTPAQNREIVHAMLRSGKNASYTEMDLDLGHDSFLISNPDLFDCIRTFLAN